MRQAARTGRQIPFLIALAALGLFFAAAPYFADDHEDKKSEKVTIKGTISDSMCGLDHTDMMAKHGGEAKDDETACVKECIKGGAKYVLADPDARKTYTIKNQEDVAKYAGKRVQIEGKLDPDGTIDVHKITLAP
jgi:hypothetical protein